MTISVAYLFLWIFFPAFDAFRDYVRSRTFSLLNFRVTISKVYSIVRKFPVQAHQEL